MWTLLEIQEGLFFVLENAASVQLCIYTSHYMDMEVSFYSFLPFPGMFTLT